MAVLTSERQSQIRTKRLDISGLKRAVHPQEEWEWPIAVYLYLAGMGAGAFAVGVLVKWLVNPDIPSLGMLLWGPLLVALGAPFLVLDLGKKMRFINACLNPKSSWASRGFVILTSLIVIGLAAFALAALPDILPLFGIASPAWLSSQPMLSRILEGLALALSLGTAAYTGVFLKSVKYVSLWNTWSLPVLFLFSALSTGAMALIVFLLGFGLIGGNAGVLALIRTLIPVEILLVVLESAALAWLLHSLHRAGKTEPRTIRHLALKSSPSLILGLIFLVSALLIPSTFGASVAWPYATLLLLTGALVLGGGFMLRYDVVKTGTKDEHPLHRMAVAQYDWRAVATPDAIPVENGNWMEAPATMPLVYAAKRAERPVFELAFSVFRAGSNGTMARVKVLASLYRSWRHPVKVEYTVNAEGA